MITFTNCTRGDLLGVGAFYRVTCERGLFAFGDHDLRVGMDRVVSAIAGETWLRTAAPVERTDGDDVAVLDVYTLPAAAQMTVADLANFLNDATYLIDVRSVEKIAPYSLTGGSSANAAAAARQDAVQTAEKEKAAENPLNQAASSLHTILVLAILAVVLFGWVQVRRVFRS